MTTAAIPVGQRDHSLVGADSWRAVEIGLAAADWHHTDLPRAVMKDPMKRSDKAAIRDTVPLVRVADRRCGAVSISGAPGRPCRFSCCMA